MFSVFKKKKNSEKEAQRDTDAKVKFGKRSGEAKPLKTSEQGSSSADVSKAKAEGDVVGEARNLTRTQRSAFGRKKQAQKSKTKEGSKKQKRAIRRKGSISSTLTSTIAALVIIVIVCAGFLSHQSYEYRKAFLNRYAFDYLSSVIVAQDIATYAETSYDENGESTIHFPDRRMSVFEKLMQIPMQDEGYLWAANPEAKEFFLFPLRKDLEGQTTDSVLSVDGVPIFSVITELALQREDAMVELPFLSPSNRAEEARDRVLYAVHDRYSGLVIGISITDVMNPITSLSISYYQVQIFIFVLILMIIPILRLKSRVVDRLAMLREGLAAVRNSKPVSPIQPSSRKDEIDDVIHEFNEITSMVLVAGKSKNDLVNEAHLEMLPSNIDMDSISDTAQGIEEIVQQLSATKSNISSSTSQVEIAMLAAKNSVDKLGKVRAGIESLENALSNFEHKISSNSNIAKHIADFLDEFGDERNKNSALKAAFDEQVENIRNLSSEVNLIILAATMQMARTPQGKEIFGTVVQRMEQMRDQSHEVSEKLEAVSSQLDAQVEELSQRLFGSRKVATKLNAFQQILGSTHVIRDSLIGNIHTALAETHTAVKDLLGLLSTIKEQDQGSGNSVEELTRRTLALAHKANRIRDDFEKYNPAKQTAFSKN